MPIFDVYSIADADFLSQVLISLAMICKTLSFMTAVKIGMVLGVFVAVFQSISKNGQEFPIGSIFLGYIIFSLMFVPKATVQVIDTYTASVKVVDEVPIGPAAAGGIISSMGRKLTDLFELGYGPIAPYLNSQIGFADTLKILNDTRRVAVQPALVQAMNAELCGVAYGSTVGCTIDVNASLENYIRDCTLKKIDLGLMNSSELQTIPYKDALKFSSLLHNTLLFDKPSLPEGTLTTCDAAWTTLDKMIFDSTNGEKTATQLANMLGISHIAAASSSVEYKSRLQGAIDGLMPVAMSSQEYIATSVIQPALNRAANDKSINQLDGSTAIMVNAAIQQRNTQWAGEQSMFMSVVRPMMAFFEAFIYSVSPIMAFLFVLGAPGIKFAGKYFLLLLWVQLWMPLLSIVNLYIYVAGHREMQTISSQPGGNFVSFYTMNTSADVLQNWLAVGGMLAASTPVLALMLIYGGAVTATSMASRMAGSDHINEKTVAPDPVSTAPVLNAGSQFTGNQYTATSAITGAPAMTTSLSNQASHAKSAMESRSQAASQQFSAALSNATSGTASQEERSSVASAASAAFKSSTSDSVAAARSYVQSNAVGAEFNASSAQKIESAISLGSSQDLQARNSGGGSKGGKGGIIGAILGAASDFGLSQAETRVAVDAVNQRASNGQSLSTDESSVASLSSDIARNLVRDNTKANSTSDTNSASNTLTSAASNLLQTQQSLTDTSSAINQVMSSSNATIPEIAARGGLDPKLQSLMNQSKMLLSPSERSQIQDRASEIANATGRDFQTSENQALLQHLTDPNKLPADSDMASRWSQVSSIVAAYNHNSGGYTSSSDVAQSYNTNRHSIESVSPVQSSSLASPASITSSSPAEPTAPAEPINQPRPSEISGNGSAVLTELDRGIKGVSMSHDRMVNTANSSPQAADSFNSARTSLIQASDKTPDLRTQFGASMLEGAGDLVSQATYIDGADARDVAQNVKSMAFQNENAGIAANTPAQNAERADSILSAYSGNTRFDSLMKENMDNPQPVSSAYAQAVSGLSSEQQAALRTYNQISASSIGQQTGQDFNASEASLEASQLMNTPGLTQPQQQILTGAATENEPLRQQGIHNLYRSMAEKDQDNNPRIENGAYVLTPDRHQEAAAIVKVLSTADEAGDAHTQGNIAPVVSYNKSRFSSTAD